jgi:hypothetical protein
VVPARAYTLGTAVLKPQKCGLVCTLTRELAATSAAEAVIGDLLSADASLTLDSALFSADPGTAPGHHPGLLNGLTAGTGGATMVDDLAKLAESVMSGGAGGDPVFICGAGRAAAARLRMPAEASAVMLGSSAVAADRLIAIDAAALVFGFANDIEITAGTDPVVHLDTSPLDIGTPGSPPTVAAPTVSMFQVASIALRLLVPIAFAARRAGAVAFMDGCTW